MINNKKIFLLTPMQSVDWLKMVGGQQLVVPNVADVTATVSPSV